MFSANKKYISAKMAASLTGYSQDYIGQLCRFGKIDSKRIGKDWYVFENSILKYKNLSGSDKVIFIPKWNLSKMLLPLAFGLILTFAIVSIPSQEILKSASSFFSEAAVDIRDLAFYTKDNLKKLWKIDLSEVKLLTANTVGSIKEKTLGPFDQSGVVVYRGVNSFFDRMADFFNPTEIIYNTIYITKKEESKKQTPPVKVVEKVIERIISSPVATNTLTNQYLDARLEQLNNKIASDISTRFANLSSGSGGSVTNIYQQIANSQKIDNLYNTAISSPNITGGSISGTAVSATSLSASTLSSGPAIFSSTVGIGTTTPGSLLSIGNSGGINFYPTATSTFSSSANGINITNGCFSIGGVCIGVPAAAAAGDLTGTTLASNVVLSSLTSLGTLTSLTVSGTTTLSGIPANVLLSTNSSGVVTATSTPTFGSFNATSTVATSTISTGGLVVGINQFVIQQNSGNIGIGTSTPWALLSVNPNALGTNVPSFVIGSSTNTKFIISNTGNVGIASSTPGYGLSVAGSGFFDGGTVTASSFVATSSIKLTGISVNSVLATDASGNISATSTPTFGFFNATSTNATSTIQGSLYTAISELIGTTTTSNFPLTVRSTLYPQMSLSDTRGIAQWTFRNAGGNLYLATTTVAGNATTSISALWINGSTGTATFGDGTYKIDVGTIDPPYIIDGTRYATYLPGMVGVKEEVTGVVKLSRTTGGSTGSPRAGVFSYSIDFNHQPTGSDLWMFSKVTDWGRDMDNLVILLSASHPQAKVWYTKEPNSNHLTIYGNGNFEVSYRLTAPRFDSNSFANITAIQDGNGFHPNDANFQGAGVASSSDVIINSNDYAVGSGQELSLTKILAELVNQFDTIGAKFINGIAYFKNIFTGKLTVGSADKPVGITLYDEMTKEPYCLKMRNGATLSVAGDCTMPTATTTPPSMDSINSPQAGSGQADTSTPIIWMMGNNPAVITIGVSYSDLGAIVTDTNADGSVNNNLGLHYVVNGISVNSVSIDTTATSTNTVVYSSVDGVGNWGYATRTVEVVAQ